MSDPTGSPVDLVSIINAGATVTTSLLTGIYIYYTRKTFIEIKKQTENQIRAYLLLVAKLEMDSGQQDRLLGVRGSWDAGISKHFQELPMNSQFLSLELKNRGKTDICWWKIVVKLQIEVGSYLAGVHLQDGRETMEIEYADSSQMIQPENSITVHVGRIGWLPKTTFTYEVVYRDLHGKTYKQFSGDGETVVENKLVFEYKK